MNISLIENEPQRLAALLKYNLLDENADISYDDLTLIASHICDTPIALVTLVDKENAHFKSTIGLSLTKAPREDVFCHQTIQQREVLVIEDTLADDQFKNNPFVMNEPHLRFYAGAPLIDQDNFALGTLCVMDFKPRQLKEGQVKALEALARQIMKLIELKDSRRRLNQSFETMIHSARLATLGEMANGVAHELNNPLSVIDHAIEKMKRVRSFDDNSINVIKNSMHKINGIISKLRSFSHEGANDPKEKIDIKQLLQTNLDFYASRAKEDGVHMEVHCPDQLYVETREAQISQILMNLMQNAFEAAHSAEIKWIYMKAYEEKDEVIIEVADSGAGIPKELSEEIFVPFYTTRESKDAIGLGLPVSKRLAEQNGGSLFLDPTSAETKFILKLKKETKKSSPEHWPGLPDRPLLAS